MKDMLLTDEEIIASLDCDNEKDYHCGGVTISTIDIYPSLQAQLDKCLSKFKEIVGEMTLGSETPYCYRNRKAQLHHSQQEILENIEKL